MGQHTLPAVAHSLRSFVLSLWTGSCSYSHLLPNKGLLLWETTGVQQVALGPGGGGLGVLPLGVGGRPNLQVLGNLLNKSGLPLPSTLDHDSLHHP